jgi:hypothetical protein
MQGKLEQGKSRTGRTWKVEKGRFGTLKFRDMQDREIPGQAEEGKARYRQDR